MSAPDNPTSKAPPSLLAEAPANRRGAQAGGSRILADLEGRVVPPATSSRAGRRTRGGLAVAALLIGAAGFGAWHLSERGGSAVHADRAAVAASAVVAANKAVVPDAASASQEAANAASTTAATIVADDDTANFAKPEAGASAALSDDGRLSRVLANGAHDAEASAASPGAAPLASASRDAERKHAGKKAEARHEAKSAAHAANSRTELAAKKRHDAHAGPQKDDSDADLLAVLVARTKPAEGKAKAAHSVKAAAANSTLAQQVKACGERGFFEDQLCRWRVCDGHWGKDAACPTAARADTDH